MINKHAIKGLIRNLFIGLSPEEELSVLSKFEDIKFNRNTWLYPVMVEYVNERIEKLKTK